MGAFIGRDEFEARIENIELQIRAAADGIRSDLREYIAEQRTRDAGRDKLWDERFEERERRFEERNRRLELIAANAERSAARAETLRAHLWLATLTTVLAVAGTGAAMVFEIRANNLALVQAVFAAIQHGQQSALLLQNH